MEYIKDGILSRIIQEAGGKDKSIVIITSATSIPVETTATYKAAFEKLGCDNLHFMDIRDRETSEDETILETMRNAHCVMFTGGDQSKIVKYIGGTTLEQIIKDKYQNSNFVIAGTSAGAMAMSEQMITGGGKNEILIKGAVFMGKGLGFFPQLIIDSHFILRRRFGRLAEAVARYPEKLGIGLAENTGLIIKKGGTECEVIGSGMMTLFDPRELTYNDESKINEGDYITLTNLKTHILANGSKFNIHSREIASTFQREIVTS